MLQFLKLTSAGYFQQAKSGGKPCRYESLQASGR